MKREIKGMFTGLGITLKTMMKPTVTVQYPHEREDPPTRARGVIALKPGPRGGPVLLAESSTPGWSVPDVAGSGHGIIGMRERVSLLGGEFSAGPLPGYGFQVSAHIPLPAGSA